MAANPPGQAYPNKTRVAILAELEKERRRLMQNQSMNTPGASISLSRPSLKEFRDNAEQQHIAAQQKAALQDSSFGNLILPVLPRLEPES
uniref:SOSS complex subunit C-like isoform X2 n=1 Tax=Scatophagus argus TaxID=75038 RepID=UPI001ED809F9|nr:SOSS complex subunit C-like isoform X2 [Scatophagus argus]XP_046230652.1 SOSS complex subunit C-like isoform X2 [Scatophagus argus]